MKTTTWRLQGHTVHDHTMEVPWDHADPVKTLGTLNVFVREIVPPGGDNYPYIMFFQGGPGSGSPRPLNLEGGWIGRLLKEYRVLLLDQRGTARSTRQDAQTILAHGDVDAQVQHLRLLRTDQIVADAEAFRAELNDGKPWAVCGQSYGGFCITTYLSYHPDAITSVLYTGGTPTLDQNADELYRLTYAKVAKRSEQFYREVPFAQARIREICHHLDNVEEFLPTGERLTSRRFRMMGINLGRDTGFVALRYLLEDPFVTVGGTKRLSLGFLNEVGGHLSYAGAPLYGLMHETIYAGATPALEGQATNWAAHRMRAEVPGFAEEADPLNTDEPFYLTGEHIYPWQFDEDPALRDLKPAALALAQYTDWPPLYLPEVLAEVDVPGAAAIYYDDIFVPLEPSVRTAELIGLKPYITNVFQHSGIGTDGPGIYSRLLDMIRA